MSWLQELTPMDVEELRVSRAIPAGGSISKSWSATGAKYRPTARRTAPSVSWAMLAALLNGPNEGGLYFFEEIDSGIHPNRLWLLLDLIAQQDRQRRQNPGC